MTRSEERNEHLIRLLPRIKDKANSLVLTYRSDLNPADVVQESVSAFLDRAKADPAFLNQDDDAIVARIVKDGWNAVRRQHTQEIYQVDLELVDENGDYFYRTLPTSTLNQPEEAVIAAQQVELLYKAIADMQLGTRGSKETYFAIVRGLLEGLKPSTIMGDLGIKKQNWPYYRKRLQHTFVALAL